LRTGEDRGVYSATKQQGKRTYRKIDPGKEYPLVIRKDLMDIRKTDNKLLIGLESQFTVSEVGLRLP